MTATKDLLAGMYRQIFMIRTFENQCIKLYRSGAIRGDLANGPDTRRPAPDPRGRDRVCRART